MKKIIKGLSLITIIATLSACKPFAGSNITSDVNGPSSDIVSSSVPSSENSSSDESSSSIDSSSEYEPDSPLDEPLNEHGLANDVQDGVILHAFNWSINNIKNNLTDIAKAGYSAIQTSPLQPQKDYYPNGNWNSQWWKLYQPLGFSIATKNHALGNKQDLIDLCNEADKYGIKIIVDVVANHLANKNGKDVNPEIKEYEPEIYEQNLFHPFSNGVTNDKTTKNVVQGHLNGLPDLMTESSVVQDRVYSLLKEYIDCGVDGFRFDAAKHIETVDDGEYASNFWPNTLGKAKAYYKNKTGDNLFAYAEILKTPGDTRKFSYYTSMMSLTDSEASFDIFDGLIHKDLSKVAKSDIYNQDILGKNAILWGESHDTFSNSNGYTKHESQLDVNKAYAIASARNDSSSLYFPRPTNDSKLGEVKTYDWKEQTIAEVNKFHNTFIGSEQTFYTNDDLFITTSFTSNKMGAVIVTLNDTSNLNSRINGLGDGIYVDSISNNKISVNNGRIVGNISSSGIAVIYKDNAPATPFISISNEGNEILTGPTKISINVMNADSAYYILDNSEKVEFKDSTTLIIGEGIKNGEARLEVGASKGDVKITNTYEYLIMEVGDNEIVCLNLPLDKIKDKQVVAWVWKDNEGGNWVEGNLDGNTFRFTIKNPANNLLLATFARNSKVDWSNKIAQTEDIKLGDSPFINFANINWK